MIYENVIAEFYGQPWAILPSELAHYEAILIAHATAKPSEDEIIAAAGSRKYGVSKASPVSDTVRVIPMHGPILNRAISFERVSGYVSPQIFAQMVREAADDPTVRTIVLDIDSPGGTVAGTHAAAEAVRYARGKKVVIAVANDTMASGAYYIGSQATKVVVLPSSNVGSIGVIWPHVDITGMRAMQGIKTTYFRSSPDKALAQSDEPLTEDTRKYMQGTVDRMADLFAQTVAEARGMTFEHVRHEIRAQVFGGREAIKAGLADEIGTLDDVLQSLAGGSTMSQPVSTDVSTETPSMEVENPAIVAENVETPAEGPTGDVTSPAAPSAEDKQIDLLTQQIAALKAENADLKAQVEAFEKEALEKKIAALMDAAIRDGQILPGQRAGLEEDARKDFAMVERFISRIPKNANGLLGQIAPAGEERVTLNKGAGQDIVAQYLKQREEFDAQFVNPLFASRGLSTPQVS